MTVNVGIRTEFDARALWSKIEGLQNLPSRRAMVIQRIIQDGVLHNYDALAMGGNIPTIDGGNILWSRVRNRMTIAIRAKRGLGALFPILTLTGKMRRGLERGSTGGTVNTFHWSPASDIRALVRVHQYGLAPLPSLSSGQASRRITSVPPRPIVFWSKEMGRQVEALARAEVKGGAS